MNHKFLSCAIVSAFILGLAGDGMSAPLPLPDPPAAPYAVLASPPTPANPDAATRARISKTYGKLPLSFEVNQGQTDGRVKYLARGPGYSLFLTPRETVLALRSHPKRTVLRMEFVGANPHPKIAGQDKLPGKSNYFIGNDPKKWRTNIPTYRKVRYQDVYPGIDLIYYGNQRQLEYDLIVVPGADPKAIAIAFEGVERLEISDQGDLVLHIAGGQIVQRAPVIYQEIDSFRQSINGHYVLRGKDRVAFQVGAYDINRPLVIDPVVLTYSTYLGGGNDDVGNAIAVDGAGNAYVAGSTASAAPTAFPTTVGAFQTALANAAAQFDAFVTKLNTTGTALVYSTYLGGGNADVGNAIAVDGAGNAYVAGSTASAAPTAFPTTVGAFQTALANAAAVTDAFVTKLNTTGTALVYSTYLGGSFSDIGNGIAVDGANNAYVTGATPSANFPTTVGAFRTALTNPGFTDAFVTKLNTTGTALVYSTYLGGSNSDIGRGIAVDAVPNAYVTGETPSANFPITVGAFQTALANAAAVTDAFVTKLNTTGTALVYSTYLGGSSSDIGRGIALDGVGPNVYVTGSTFSANFPTANSPFQAALGGGGFSDAFVTKLNTTGTALVYSTYLGGSFRDVGNGIALDPMDNAYVTGSTESDNFPTTTGAFQIALANAPNSGDADAFVSKVTQTTTPAPPPPSGGGGGGCFVATAAFGSPLAPWVQLLREFRDRYLLTNGPGRLFVAAYYRTSPPIAKLIARSEILRGIVRVVLVPIIGWAAITLWFPILSLGIALSILGLGVWPWVHGRRASPFTEKHTGSRRAAPWRRLALWGCIVIVLSAAALLEASQGQHAQEGNRVERVGDVRLPQTTRFALVRDPKTSLLHPYKDGDAIFEGENPLPLGKIVRVHDQHLVIALSSGETVDISQGRRLPGPRGLIFTQTVLLDTLRFQVRFGPATTSSSSYAVVNIQGRRATLERRATPEEVRTATGSSPTVEGREAQVAEPARLPDEVPLVKLANRIPFDEVAPDTWEVPAEEVKEIGNQMWPLLTETLRSATPVVTMRDGVGLSLDNSLGSGTLDQQGFRIDYVKMGQRTGLEVGDRILSVNEQPVNSAGGLVRIYQQLKSDASISEVNVVIKRGGQTRTLTYRLR